MACATEIGRLVGAALLVMLAVARPARAANDEPRVAVPRLAVQGEVPSYLVNDLAKRLLGGLGTSAHAVEGTATCTDASCWVELAKQSSSTHVVQATLSVHDRDYDVRADLVDGKTGEVIATVERECDICGADELGTTLEDVGDALRRKLASQSHGPPELSITSAPVGAEVRLDGEVIGKTPLTIEVPVGEHEVEVAMADHITQRRRLAFVGGVRQEWNVALVDVPRDDSRGRRPLRIAGWSAIGVGLAGVGAGIGLVVLDESPIRSRCSGENVDYEGNCKYRYDTLGGGIAIAAVGAVALGTGIALVVVDHKRSRKQRDVAIAPTLRGITVFGRF